MSFVHSFSKRKNLPNILPAQSTMHCALLMYYRTKSNNPRLRSADHKYMMTYDTKSGEPILQKSLGIFVTNDNNNDLDGAGGSSVKIAFSRTLKKLHIGGGSIWNRCKK